MGLVVVKELLDYVILITKFLFRYVNDFILSSLSLPPPPLESRFSNINIILTLHLLHVSRLFLTKLKQASRTQGAEVKL
jgi:hypothetical protein